MFWELTSATSDVYLRHIHLWHCHMMVTNNFLVTLFQVLNLQYLLNEGSRTILQVTPSYYLTLFLKKRIELAVTCAAGGMDNRLTHLLTCRLNLEPACGRVQSVTLTHGTLPVPRQCSWQAPRHYTTLLPCGPACSLGPAFSLWCPNVNFSGSLYSNWFWGPHHTSRKIWTVLLMTEESMPGAHTSTDTREIREWI